MYVKDSTVFILTLLLFQVNSQRYRPQNSFAPQPQPTSAPPVRTGSVGSCPEKNGRYPAGQCDAYIECNDGVPEEKLCPDGLLFNPAAGVFAFPCQYPIDVDCQGRSGLQPAQATEECPHQFGYFKVGDEKNCGQFKNCADGRGYIFDCPEGLAWNQATYRCDWPDQVADCDAEAFLGFTCPPEPDARSGLGPSEYRFFRSPADCQRYYICIEGRPRLYNCGEERAFNDLINACDGIENVTNCGNSVQYGRNDLEQGKAKPFNLNQRG